ncbi:MAG: alpha/beta hydrolase [Phaeodactylibacter sp.]|nr:alpha/beta hydrolase [Phaeodactylibacter sp.]
MENEETTNGRLLAVENLLRVHQVEVTGAVSPATLVFLHDALGSVDQWGDFPRELALRCNLNAVVYDRAGHGGSSPMLHTRDGAYLHREALEVLPELLQQLRIEVPILVGHSDGGSIALIYAAYHQPLAIITEAAHVFVEEITLEGIKKAQLQKDRFIRKLSPFHGDKAETLFGAWADTWTEDGFRNWNIEGLLPRITCPALVIQGSEDQYGSDEQIRGIVSGIGARAEGFRVENCGHVPHRQAEQVVLQRMSTFIEKILKGE